MKYILLLILISGCVHVENRCIDSGLKINNLTIEDTGVFTTHAKVQCIK